MLADSPFPYQLPHKVCPHCNREYDGARNSTMCRACAAGEPGMARNRRNNARSNARKQHRRIYGNQP